ncbi:MAG TPA: Crp/Fnr family transcriptional regulator [Flavobacteriaceae bacterium]|nr:Crp/Fnr family transcriptional regulator [Flavobacteriaceae bacterium]MCB9212564.1 Crp/Fnr family transcriptional regulator [Alteromonas sp.]HPF10632.1 Crp/Fnr family transcriptional regulator [Flavobacteriaceae bacterium]HQU20914.1 Crp/Fnr family transcriptional regulator [Flavobacteriaceae bacterium]HQU64398.1 Crp/Fnr family transcriptional regulator [Flavobacteriaceae bacterium]
MDTLWFFEDVNLFQILCPHKFKAYKETHHFNRYHKQDYIYFEKDSSNKVYLIEKGKVKIGHYTEDGKEVVKAILTKGELFGEKAILGEVKRDEFAMALDNQTSVCPIGVETMHELMRDNKSFSFRVYKLIGFRIKKLERRLELILFKDARTRVEEFLKELAKDYGYCCPITGETIVKHPYTQKEIATLIGTSRPTFNAIMNEFKEEQKIDFHRHEIRLKFSA